MTDTGPTAKIKPQLLSDAVLFQVTLYGKGHFHHASAPSEDAVAKSVGP